MAQSGYDDNCVGRVPGLYPKATIARVPVTGPNHAPFFVLAGRGLPPASQPATVLLRWDTVLETDRYAAHLVERRSAWQ